MNKITDIIVGACLIISGIVLAYIVAYAAILVLGALITVIFPVLVLAAGLAGLKLIFDQLKRKEK